MDCLVSKTTKIFVLSKKKPFGQNFDSMVSIVLQFSVHWEWVNWTLKANFLSDHYPLVYHVAIKFKDIQENYSK